MEFFARIGRVLKLVGISIVPLIVIGVLNSLFGEILFPTLGASLLICLVVGIINWFFADFLNVGFLDNAFGRIVKIIFYFVTWLIVAVSQFYFLAEGSLNTAHDKIFSGNYFVDALCLGSSFAPFVMLYYGFLTSLDDLDVEETWQSPVVALIVGLVVGLVSALLFSNIEFLQKGAIWLVPVISHGLLIFVMVRHRALPYYEFPYSSKYTGYYSSGSKGTSTSNIISGVKDFFNRH